MNNLDLRVALGSGFLPNPVGVASGTFGYGGEYDSLINLSAIGAIYTKAVTLAPRPGNEIPRIVETPSGIINSIGLANVGVEAFLKVKMPFLEKQSCAVIANVAGSTEEEYAAVLERLEVADSLYGYEINVSCPNVKHGGLAFGTDPVVLERLTRRLRTLTKKPLIIKMTPNVTDITVVAKAAEQGGADGISCINTLVGMVIDIHKKRPVLPTITGGLSGPAIRPIGVAMVYRASRAVKIPVIGMGGIMSAEDAIQYMLAGAAAVQTGTGNFVNPQTPVEVLEGIVAYCRKNGLTSVSEMRTLME